MTSRREAAHEPQEPQGVAPISIPVASHEPGSETTMRPIVTVSGSSPDEKRPARSRSRPGPIAIGSMGRPSETPSEDAPDSPVFELEQPVRPSPVLKKFVHAIEVGQAIWELAHPSVVQLRRDEEFEEAREEKAELRAGVYIGLEVEFDPYPHFCVYVHDGFFALDYFVERVPDEGELDGPATLHPPKAIPRGPSFSQLLSKTTSHILSWLKHYSTASSYKLFACGFSLRSHSSSSKSNRLALSKPGRQSDLAVVDLKGGRNYPMRLPSLLWRELDCLPIVVETRGDSIEERAASACRKMLTFISASPVGPIPRISLSPTHQVQVDLSSRIHLVDLSDYARISSKTTWDALITLAAEARAGAWRVLFFNSTAQGGGVALMRHALMRVTKKLGVDARWFVMKPDPKVYEITKRKFHNVLQGVSFDPLTDADKKCYERWGRANLEKYFKGEVVQANVIVLDDPQVLCMLPHIRAANPTVKVIFRCHIEVRTDLLHDQSSPCAQVWNYLWSFARHADLFVFHPVACFVPKEVPKDRLVVMAPTTDPLDGLNKYLSPQDVSFYLRMLNRIAYDQTHRRLDLKSGRGYLIQVARFDPSKGIMELLESYKRMRELLHERGWPLEKTPQLLVTGHGSVDDPDAMRVYHAVSEKLRSDEFRPFYRDVIAVRLPPSDQLLNAALTGSLFALQLSQREGFEVKVTEALHKGKPVVVSDAGGIPHQVRNGFNGFIVPFGDIDGTAAKMVQLVTDSGLRDKMGKRAKGCVNEEFWTQLVCVNWLYMVRGLLDNTIYDRISDSPPFREQTPPANDPGTVAGLDFDYSKAETDDEYRKRRIKMAGHHPWIVKMWQADLLGESKRDETRCMSSAGIHEPDEQIELAAAAKASMEKEFSRQRSWDDNRSDTSEAPSDWGSIESSTVEGSGEGTSEGETLQGQLGDLGEILTVEAPDGDDEQQLVSEAPHN